MPQELRDRVLALAGVFQATALVRDAARKGGALTPAAEASIHSIFMVEADSVADVYGSSAGLALGLDILQQQLEGRGARDVDLTRYAVAILYLERKLARQPEMLERLRVGIESAREQASYFASETHPSVLARLADLYLHTISTLTPRIMVSGEPGMLQANAELIRALLLAGIRSAVLWRQRGGGRLQLLLRRRAMVRLAADLQRETRAEVL